MHKLGMLAGSFALLTAAVACAQDAPEPEADLGSSEAVAVAQAPLAEPITGADLASRIEAGDAPFILDVRSPEEYAGGHVPGAVNIPFDALPDRLDELPVGHGDEVVVYCRSGRRASIAEQTLAEAGFTELRDLDGHIQGWQAAGLPLE